MANDLINLWGEDGRNIISDSSTPTLTLVNTSTGAGIQAETAISGAPAIVAVVSAATGLVMDIRGAIDHGYVSTNSTASLAYALRIKVTGATNLFYYIPVYTGAAGSVSGV